MKLNWLDIIGRSDYVANIRRVGIGLALAASTMLPQGSTKWLAFAAVGIIGTTLTAAQRYLENKSHQKELLHFYKEEVGELLGKAPEQATVNDLLMVAAPVEKGGLGMKVLQDQLGDYKYEQNFHIAVNVLASALTTGTLIGLSNHVGLHDSFLNTVVQLGVVSTGFMAARKFIESTGELILGKTEDHTICHKLIDYAKKIKDQALTPVELFSIFAEANESLGEAIHKDYGKKFDNLTIVQKNTIVKAYEPEFKVASLTDAINRGDIHLSMVGLLASGQADERMKDYQAYKALSPKTAIPMQELDGNDKECIMSEHVKRLEEERIAMTPTFMRLQ